MGTNNISDRVSLALFGKARRAVLALLLGRPDETFYLREIVRHADAGQGAVQRELQRLERAGLIRRSVRGRQVYFQADPECPVFDELCRLVVKTVGAGDVLREALRPLAGRLRVAFIYGSVARGDARKGSDIDLCVVGDVTLAEVVAAVGPAQDRLAREVNPTVYPLGEFARKLREGHHFVSSVADGPKMFLIGDERELAGVAEERLAGRAPTRPRRNRRIAGHR